ncbi:MAG TPA: dTMP kinase [Burkholderiales bacterium]|nr:dTMP kinase [Burkholderiales bacterium]
MAEVDEAMSRGKFITLEGIDGAGKTTQRASIEQFLLSRGIAHVTTREPGGTPLGEKLRELLLGADARPNPETETLMMFAARREHLDKVIVPALNAGTWVLCDRFTDATFAYQCGGSGVDWGRVEALERWVHPALQPDLTLFFDVEPEVGLGRAQRIRQPDRFEREAVDFYHRVRAAYLRRAQEHQARIRRIDANRAATEVHQEVQRILSSL